MKLWQRVTIAAALAVPAVAQAEAAAEMAKPKLIVAISVDQFSADLFAEYRQHFTGGMKRLANGVVFPSGYQSHAATETCPGHSTILTGSHPARTGIIANNWFDLSLPRDDKMVYCSEDPSVPGSSSENYSVSPQYLKVPTLGDRLKVVDKATRVVSVAGKDRAAVMMGGHDTDQIWFWGGKSYVTLPGRTATPPATVSRVNASVAALVARPAKAALPAMCRSRSVALPLGPTKQVGVLADRKAEDFRGFRAAVDFDAATADLAIGLLDEMKLGRGASTDVLTIGLSATDYVGHTFGTEGAEMCAQMVGLDENVGRILAALDATRVPYAVVLTADHGGHDVTERAQTRGFPEASRVDPQLRPSVFGAALAEQFGLDPKARLVWSDGPFGDWYVARDIPADKRPLVIATLKARLLAHRQVADVFTADDLRRMTPPRPPVEEWSLAERAKASFDPERSGDLVVLLKPKVMPISDPLKGSVATHGSPWQNDRRVPILFYRPGTTGFEQPLSIETVDILPTLGALVGLTIPAEEIDGRCLDLDAGAGNSCR
ncbi:Type I phosphodiesterase / nucleotide pyrophosphatase [Sphingomonas laterariae]|uniref:Type I phosphodiesterase / nucleotide pyrophosphatase n=1 Tax=Edaphosphingomonas laterariae TaxID=861865 RepID=A0A239ELG8_9SPHN|nr:alkaline phosphatase family protein [Sphingomonas laterariae]SNS45620.1 Type I phosphodiesterase / nucleotide pyrophosphatase [Sphingomonas laterariae]